MSEQITPSHEIYDVLQEFKDYTVTKRGKNPIVYYNVPVSFDIETSSFYNKNQEKCAIMYHWQMCINGHVFIGRTWNEFLSLIHQIEFYLELGDMKRLIIYVHNLSYEFQYIRTYFTWSNIFAIDQRKPIYAVTDSGIEFRCSYLLSGYSLEVLGKNLQRYKVEKMVGDLDYEKVRTPITPITPEELKYCINDVLVVVAYIQETIENDGDITRIPLTRTGYVRKYCRNKCLYKDNNHHKEVNRHLQYRRFISNLTIEPDEYMMLKRAFQGGFTHASALYVNEVCEHVASFDFTSSYPYVMISEKFPMSKGRKVSVSSMEELKRYLLKYCCIFDITFFGLKSSTITENYISTSKCRNLKDFVNNNGRLQSAGMCTTTITEQDFFIISKFYTWDSYMIGDMYVYRKDYLPKSFVESILKLYSDKTTLKGVEGKEVEYLASKGMLNATFGMTVTDINRDTITYDSDSGWNVAPANLIESLEKENNSYKRFLFYPWGVYVTAYARRNLFSGILECGSDYIYSDTDSIKIMNPENHMNYIEGYNDNVRRKLMKAMQYHDLPMELVEPKTVEGVPKLLGVWDYEGVYDRFKTLGAKRYMIEKDGKINITVSGLNKKTAVPYINEHNPFEFFTDEMFIPADYTGKLTHTYIDEPVQGTVVDYMGTPYEYYEETSIHMEKVEFTMNLSDIFINFLRSIK